MSLEVKTTIEMKAQHKDLNENATLVAKLVEGQNSKRMSET